MELRSRSFNSTRPLPYQARLAIRPPSVAFQVQAPIRSRSPSLLLTQPTTLPQPRPCNWLSARRPRSSHGPPQQASPTGLLSPRLSSTRPPQSPVALPTHQPWVVFRLQAPIHSRLPLPRLIQLIIPPSPRPCS